MSPWADHWLSHDPGSLEAKRNDDASGDSTRRQKLKRRDNYAHHAFERESIILNLIKGYAGVKEVPTKLAGVSDYAQPKTGYASFFKKRLDGKYEAVFVQRLLNQFNLNSKILMRDNKYMIYIKDSEKISDFLKIIQAFNAVLYYEDIRILREQKNMTNRLNNCEQANIDKIILTSNKQLEEINLIDKQLGLDFLDDKIKEACVYRLKYPESSLAELSEIMSLETGKTITKSGLNHRFRKIREIAEKLNEMKKEEQ